MISRVLLVALFILSPFHPSTLDLVAQTTGKEFWICVPPNEIEPYSRNGLEIYLSSEYDTEIEVYDAAADSTYTQTVTAGEVRTLSDRRGETSWTWEIREFEQAIKKGIRIRSKDPIAVHVLNSKTASSDGYMAIPTEAWGRDYVVASSYDFNEMKPWAGGFCVIAKEPTSITITLRGTYTIGAKTSGGKSIGNVIKVNLDAGEVYAVCGDGTTRGVFDLTGTSIRSDKPVGVFGFHQRTAMPSLLQNGNGRDHLVEMLPPTYMWGKRYATLEIDRNGTIANARGDLFRLIGSEQPTRWSFKFYDKQNRKLLGQGGGRLDREGDFAHISESTGPNIITYGFSIWEADKPILVAQYSTSSSFDGDVSLDPFMMICAQPKQFLARAVSQAATSFNFSTHMITLIVECDTADPNYVDNLKSLTLNGVPVWSSTNTVGTGLLSNHMRDNLHWVRLRYRTPAKSMILKGNGKVTFSGYVHGYGSMNSYGWPLASATNDVRSQDTMPPVITGTMNCGTFTAEATELRNIPDPPRSSPHDTDQVDKGIAEIDTVRGAGTYNYRIVFVTDSVLPRDPSYKRFLYNCEVIDLSKPAYCVYFVRDWANNITIDTLRYYPASITLSPDVVRFGERPLNSRDTIDVTITNNGVTHLFITSTTLEIGQRYTLLDAVSAPGITLSPGQSHALRVVYHADDETQNITTDLDIDSLEITLKCAKWRIPVSGVASQALIEVEDYNAGYVDPGVTTCKSGGLKITNYGSDTLVITGFTGLAGTNFSVSPAGLTALPYMILPKSIYLMKDVCYQRSDAGTDSIVVTFSSNANGPKPTSIWKARTTITSVTELTEDDVSISMSTNTLTVSWKGAGVSRITVTDLLGQQLGTSDIDLDASTTVIPISATASQLLFVTLFDAEGTTLATHKCQLR